MYRYLIILAMLGLLQRLPSAIAETEEQTKVKVSNIRRVFHNGEHNAFTDLIRFQDQFFLCFRSCPDGHGVNASASVIVLTSPNARDWTPIHQFSVAGRDTRDPHFLIFKDRLFIYTGTWYDSPDKQYDLNEHLGYAVWSSDGKHWSRPIPLEGTFGHYIWKASTFDGKAFLCGRRKTHFRVGPKGEGKDVESAMLESNDGLIWRHRTLFQETTGDETAFLFEPDGSIMAIGRRGSHTAQLCLSPSKALMSWYSTHEKDPEGQAITAIYMADLELRSN